MGFVSIVQYATPSLASVLSSSLSPKTDVPEVGLQPDDECGERFGDIAGAGVIETPDVHLELFWVILLRLRLPVAVFFHLLS